MVIHAMPMRPQYETLLPPGATDMTKKQQVDRHLTQDAAHRRRHPTPRRRGQGGLRPKPAAPRGGRPRMGSALPRSFRYASTRNSRAVESASAEHTSTSEIIREALRRFLDVA